MSVIKIETTQPDFVEKSSLRREDSFLMWQEDGDVIGEYRHIQVFTIYHQAN